MKQDNNKVVKSVDGNDYVEISIEGHKDSGRNASYW